jgi:hypothetical protein
MEPITLLQAQEFERRLATHHRTPAQRHLAALRQRRAEARRVQVLRRIRSLRPTRRQPAATLEPCGC